MKQFITINDINELSDKAKDAYAKYVTAWPEATWHTVCKEGAPIMLSTGQLIEYLDFHSKHFLIMKLADGWEISIDRSDRHVDDLCDGLWICVKEYMEKE